MVEITSHSAGQTESLGEQLATLLKAGSIVAFDGELAAGKTTMIRGICHGLHVRTPVQSPTFTLINEYQGKLPVYHLDCYRERRKQEWLALGIEDYLYGKGVTLIEWADAIRELMPQSSIRIIMNHVMIEENSRAICFQALPDTELRIRQFIRTGSTDEHSRD
jgi:tRNA threonylcarbamoyladenosine biosynthesis protein TsaE